MSSCVGMIETKSIKNINSNAIAAPSSVEDLSLFNQIPPCKRYKKRKVLLAVVLGTLLAILLISVMEIGVRDYFFNYLKEQTDLLFNSGEIIVLKEDNNKLCVISNGGCVAKRPTRVHALKRGLRRVGKFISKPFRRRNPKKFTQDPEGYRRKLPDYIKILDDRVNQVPGLKERAKAVNWPIDHSNVKRWLDVANFDVDDYQSQPLEKHIEKTVQWREEFGACCISESEFGSSKTSSVYIQGKDRFGRPILIFAPSEDGEFDVSVYLRLLIFSIEKAVQMMDGRVEKFAVVVDCSKFGFNSLPPASFFTTLFKILMAHYPARLGVVLVADASGPVQFMWKVVNSVLTERTRKKIFFLEENETATSMLDKISNEMVEWKAEL